MALLEINGIKLYGYHGCFEEEQNIGQYYIIDVIINADLEIACINDDLLKTIDYAIIYTIVKTEMAIKSKLIEHVAYRIKNTIEQRFSTITDLKVSVAKPLPPVHGEIKYSRITV